MKYEVIKDFVDVQNDNHLYRVGDPFPYNDADVSEERIDELASDKNRVGVVLIRSVEDENENGVEDSKVDIAEEKPKKNKKKEK